jgi:hypothetical protein
MSLIFNEGEYMKTLEFMLDNGKKIRISVQHIVSILQTGTDETPRVTLLLVNGEPLNLKGKYADIVATISEFKA